MMFSISWRSSSERSSSAAGGRALDVVRSARPYYRGVHGRVGERPGDRELHNRAVPLLGEPLQLLDCLQVSLEVLAPEEVALGAPVVTGALLVGGHPPGEQPVGQRSVDEDPDAVLGGVGECLLLDVAPEEVVGRLQAVDLAPFLELGHLLDAEVRDADVADLTLLDHLVQGPGGLLEGGVEVRPVDLVEVYVIGAQETQGFLDALPEPLGARVAEQLLPLHPQAPLGCQDYLVPAVLYLGLERLAQKLLGGAEPVSLGGVEEVDAELQRP